MATSAVGQTWTVINILEVPVTGRIQLAINVNDLEASISFYGRLFGTEPAKVKPGYANFAIDDPPLKLVLIENPGQGGSLNHLGIEVRDTDMVDAEQGRLADVGLASVDERDTTCCYAKQDKFWVKGTPDDERWEIYAVLADSQTFWGQDGGQSRAALEASLDAEASGPQVGAASEFMLRFLPPGTLPPEIINFSASSVPILQLGISGKGMSEQKLNDVSQNFIRPQLITVPGAVIPLPYGGKQRQIMVNMDQGLMQAKDDWR